MQSNAKIPKSVNVRAMVEAAMFVALAFILSLIKIYQLPYGGSITAVSMLPILLIGFRHGPGWGIGAGFVYGLIQFLFDGYVLTPFNIFLDYLLGFAFLGISGFFTKGKLRFYIGSFAGCLGRFICSFLSGILFYYEYAADWGMSPWLYSLCYNGSYIVGELILLLIVGTVLIRFVPQLRELGR